MRGRALARRGGAHAACWTSASAACVVHSMPASRGVDNSTERLARVLVQLTLPHHRITSPPPGCVAVGVSSGLQVSPGSAAVLPDGHGADSGNGGSSSSHLARRYTFIRPPRFGPDEWGTKLVDHLREHGFAVASGVPTHPVNMYSVCLTVCLSVCLSVSLSLCFSTLPCRV